MKVISIDQGAVLGEDVKKDLETLFNEKYDIFLKERNFSLFVKKDGGEVNVTVTLEDTEGNFHYPVESRIDYAVENLRPEQAALFLVDYIDLYFQDFFENGENVFLPIDWTDHEYDAVSFQLRGQILNLRLERLADQWLEGQSPSL